MVALTKDVLVNVLYFVAWTALSTVAHSASAVVVGTTRGSQDCILLTVVILSLAQYLFSALFPITYKCERPQSKGTNMGILIAVASLCNGIAIYTTLLSFVFNSPSTTLALKTTEPLMASVVKAVLCSRLTLVDVSGLPLTILTVAVYVVIERPQSVQVCMIPLLSNVAFACRNTMLKHADVESKQLLFFFVNLWSTIAAAAGVQYLWDRDVVTLIMSTSAKWLVLLSGIATGAYAFISTQVILNRFSVVLHSSLNSVKRILVTFFVFVFWSYSSRKIELHHIMMASVPVTISLALLYRTNRVNQHSEVVGASSEKDKLDLRKSTLLALLLVIPTIYLTASSCAAGPGTKGIVLNETLRVGKYHNTEHHLLNDYQRDLYTNISKVLKGKKYTILMNTQCAYFGNRGDFALNYGTVVLLDYFKVKVLASCCAVECNPLLKRTKSILESTVDLTKDNFAFIYVGGGNFGDLYGITVTNFANFLRTFPTYNYIIFPQSPYYMNRKGAEKHAKLFDNYASQITFLARDQLSYNRMVDEYKFTFKIILTIDTAFAFGLQKLHYLPFVNILLFLRSDFESTKHIFNVTNHKEYSFLRGDWIHPTSEKIDETDTPKVLATYDELVAEPFWFISRGCVMITDRLHGHIIASLSQKPHVLLDNSYGKLSGFYQTWTSTLPYVRYAQNIDDAFEKAVILLKEYPCPTMSPNATVLVL